MSDKVVLPKAARQQIQALAIEGAQHRHIASIIADESPFPRHGHRLAFADCDHPDCKFVRDLDRVLAALACEGEESDLDAALKLAKEATNGWGCYAKRDIEHREIARLHTAIDILSARAVRGEAQPLPAALNQIVGYLREIEQHCPCGARPESPTTHPHVGGCPVDAALRAAAEAHAPEPPKEPR